MSDSSIQVTEGAGVRLQTDTRSIGGNTVHAEYALPGMSAFPIYYCAPAAFSSTATANAHLIQIMAGASKPVYIARIAGYLRVAATATSVAQFSLLRLTTAGTGGTGPGTISPLDSTDGAVGATTRFNLTASKGTTGAVLDEVQATVPNALSTSLLDLAVFKFDYTDGRRKMPRIPAGTSNGIAVSIADAIAGGSLFVVAHIIELSY